MGRLVYLDNLKKIVSNWILAKILRQHQEELVRDGSVPSHWTEYDFHQFYSQLNKYMYLIRDKILALQTLPRTLFKKSSGSDLDRRTNNRSASDDEKSTL